MILKGMGNNNFLITRGFGVLKKLVVEVISLITEFYNKIILQTIFKQSEIFNLKTFFNNNILLRSNIDMIALQELRFGSSFNNRIMLKSNITMKRA